MSPSRIGTILSALSTFLVGLFVAFPSPALAAGELDPTFDGDGRVVSPFGFGGRGNAVAIQADGKIVVAGVVYNPQYDTPSNFVVARYNPDGSLDTSFSGDGRRSTDFGAEDIAFGVAIQPDGKIVAAGRTGFSPASMDFALARYNADGSHDGTFDGDGKVVTDLGAGDQINGVAIQADGRIVAAGVSGNDFALLRYSPNGSLDSSFDGDGTLRTDFGGDDQAFDLAIQTDGKIVAAGTTGSSAGDFALARYDPDGSLDQTFAGDGKLVTDLGQPDEVANDLAIQPDGKILAAGYSALPGDHSNFALARYHLDGTLDPTFGGDGKIVTDLGAADRINGVAIQADGRIVAAGSAIRVPGDQADFALARYNPDGSLDAPAFGGDGKVLIDFTMTVDVANDIAIQADGKIVTAGESNAYLALTRFLAIGSESRISVNDVTRFEGNAGVTSFAFNLSLSKPSSETVTVTRQTVNGSASAPSDYAALSAGTITFMPGQTTKTVTVNVNGEVAVEPNETFFLNLSSPANATIADGSGKGTIQNDDLSDSASCTITGTNGNDVLNGTAGNDVICGGRGDDQIYGLDGADVLKGEDGNDLLVGGSSYDLLIGDRGSDDLRGEGWNDTLRGGDQNDTLNGAAGSDALFGDTGGDSLNAQDGVSANDSADGGASGDSCVFDSGDFVTSCP